MREMRRDGERGGVGWEEDGEGRCAWAFACGRSRVSVGPQAQILKHGHLRPTLTDGCSMGHCVTKQTYIAIRHIPDANAGLFPTATHT